MKCNLYRLSVLFLPALFSVGCSTIPDIVPQIPLPILNKPSAPIGKDIEQANDFLAAGKQHDAASAYFAAANHYPSPQRERLILQAAELAANFKDNNLAQRYLDPISSSASFNKMSKENQARFRLVQGQLAINDGNQREALRIFPQRVSDLPPALGDKILKARMTAAQSSRDKLALIQELVLQEPRLQNRDAIDLNHKRIWNLIKQMPLQNIKDGASQINHPILKQWLTLGAMAREVRANETDESSYQRGIKGWIKLNPTHPGIVEAKKLLKEKPTAVVTPYRGG